jgi:hypothetical protein
MSDMNPNPLRINDLRPYPTRPQPCVAVRTDSDSSDVAGSANSRQTMNEDLKNEMLKSISYGGKSEIDNSIIIGSPSNISQVVDLGSGSPRFHRSVISKFRLILSQPVGLHSFSNLEIRCTLCRRVISYPCWYLSIRYAINHFHYFVCFNSDSPNKPNTRCFKRS